MTTRAVIICGSRSLNDTIGIMQVIQSLPVGTHVITGGAPGADSIAHQLATARKREQGDVTTEVIHADWNTHGRSAGPRRNGEMLRRLLEFDERHVYAFPTGGPGTRNMIDQARRAGVEVTVQED